MILVEKKRDGQKSEFTDSLSLNAFRNNESAITRTETLFGGSAGEVFEIYDLTIGQKSSTDAKFCKTILTVSSAACFRAKLQIRDKSINDKRTSFGGVSSLDTIRHKYTTKLFLGG